MRTVWLLAGISAAGFVAWAVAPSTSWLTIALVSGGAAAYRAVAISSLAAWWRYAAGLPPTVGVIMLWWADGRLLVLLLWLLTL
ncbi:MAG: hypothetical protein ACE5PT_11325, partial [Gemmatimonadales bacterium]